LGLVIAIAADRAIVPAATLLAEADRLPNVPKTTAGSLGIDVQPLTASVASVTGGEQGVVVTWVEPDGAARGLLSAGDVIESIDHLALATPEHWDVRVARLSAGETVTLGVRRHGEVREIAVVAAGDVEPPLTSLGATLRVRPGIGAEVIRVEAAAAASRAGLAAGDVITRVADLRAPTPGQVARSYAALGAGQRLLIAVTRGSRHFVTTVDR
jgi:S1-C subfamily serine protease